MEVDCSLRRGLKNGLDEEMSRVWKVEWCNVTVWIFNSSGSWHSSFEGADAQQHDLKINTWCQLQCCSRGKLKVSGSRTMPLIDDFECYIPIHIDLAPSIDELFRDLKLSNSKGNNRNAWDLQTSRAHRWTETNVIISNSLEQSNIPASTKPVCHSSSRYLWNSRRWEEEGTSISCRTLERWASRAFAASRECSPKFQGHQIQPTKFNSDSTPPIWHPTNITTTIKAQQSTTSNLFKSTITKIPLLDNDHPPIPTMAVELNRLIDWVVVQTAKPGDEGEFSWRFLGVLYQVSLASGMYGCLRWPGRVLWNVHVFPFGAVVLMLCCFSATLSSDIGVVTWICILGALSWKR